MTTPEPPPEAQLIARLREEAVPPLSMREAARRAGMSPTLWKQNEQGYRTVAAGVTLPWRATDTKLAGMALIVGATPEQLKSVGRDEAARILEKLIEAGPDEAVQLVRAIEDDSLTAAQKRALIELIQREL